MRPLTEWAPTSEHFENRVSSLTPRSVRFLDRIGAWSHVRAERVQSYDDMRVWDGLSDARIEFEPSMTAGEEEEVGAEGAGWSIAHMVENKNLQAGVLARLMELNEDLALEGIAPTEILDNSRVKRISTLSKEKEEKEEEEAGRDDDLDLSTWPVIELENGKRLRTRLLVGADGANSPARTFASITARGWGYERHGLVATVRLEWDDFRTTAFQRFLKTGPIALLPLPGEFSSLVWSCTPEMAEVLKRVDGETFCVLVNAAFRLQRVDIEYLVKLASELTTTAEKASENDQVGESVAERIQDELDWRLENTPLEDVDNNYPTIIASVQAGSRASFPLRMQHADTYVSDKRVALVGDAAHTTHPLAGQGLNMGQQDVESLVDALQVASTRGLDIGSLLAIEPYWADRYFANHIKLGVVDKLHKLYSADLPVLVALRSVGLSVVNSLEFVKKELMRQASN